jgi:tetratricopeptide (TPR) repeat protein
MLSGSALQNETPRASPRWARWCGAALIAAVTLAVYWPAMHGGWLWDDHIDIARNAGVHDPAGWWKIWLQPAGWHFLPLKSTVQWAQWQLWQERTFGYHLTSVALHALSALLLWRLLARLGLRFAWLGGLLFAVHPLAVESVAWLTELKNTLSLPLALLAVLAYLDYDERGRKRDLVFAALLFLASMLAKSSAVMLPFVVLLHARWKRGRIGARDLGASAPFFLISFGIGLATVLVEQKQDAVALGLPVLGMASRLAGAGLAVGFYFFKALVPVGLAPVYPEWALASPAAVDFLPWPVIGALAWALWRHWQSWGRHAALGLGFFLLNLVPVLGFVPFGYHHIAWVADHLAYLPLVGLVGLAVAGVEFLAGRLSGMAQRWLVGAVVALAAAWAWQSHGYAAIFAGEETFWRSAAARYPDTVLPHRSLAQLLVDSQRTDEAIRHYEAALRVKPDGFETLNDLGVTLLGLGRVREALMRLERAARLRPNDAEVHFNLGNALAQAGRAPEAAAECERAVQLKSNHAAAHVLLGTLAAQAGRLADSAGHLEAALQANPADAMAHNNLANVLMQSGRAAEARRHYDAAVRLAPNAAVIRVNFGAALLAMERTEEAMAQWREAVRLSPDAVDVRLALAGVLARAGRADEAIRECEEVLRVQPDHAAAREYLGRLRAVSR